MDKSLHNISYQTFFLCDSKSSPSELPFNLSSRSNTIVLLSKHQASEDFLHNGDTPSVYFWSNEWITIPVLRSFFPFMAATLFSILEDLASLTDDFNCDTLSSIPILDGLRTIHFSHKMIGSGAFPYDFRRRNRCEASSPGPSDMIILNI